MSQGPSNPRRALTPDEQFVLEQIQDLYGPQNSDDRVFFSDGNEAVLVVVDQNGVRGMFVALTNLGAWYTDGTIKTVQELRKEWLTAN